MPGSCPGWGAFQSALGGMGGGGGGAGGGGGGLSQGSKGAGPAGSRVPVGSMDMGHEVDAGSVAPQMWNDLVSSGYREDPMDRNNNPGAIYAPGSAENPDYGPGFGWPDN